MNTTEYKRAYNRESDTTMMSEEILKNKDLFKEFDCELASKRKKRTTWKSIDNAHSVIVPYIGDNAIETLQDVNIEFDKNILSRNVSYSITFLNSSMSFPSLSAREEYKPEVMKLYGCTVSGVQGFHNEYNELLGLMYQYLYLMETDKNARKTFEELNMAGKLRRACKLLAAKEIYNKEDFRSNYRYCEKLFATTGSYSSFDAALQLIDRMENDKEGVLELVKEMGEKPEYIEQMVKDSGIITHNYNSFRKTIEKRKK